MLKFFKNMEKSIGLISLIGLIYIVASASTQTKEADLAGSWYPADSKELSAMLDKYLDAASPPEIEGKAVAIISPHAGYVYSAPVAVWGYKLLSGRKINTVIVLGFSHRQHYDGVSIYKDGEFKTPLGSLSVDNEIASLILSKNNRFSFYPQLFENENSIEMQLPFIKKILPQAKIVPIAFGVSNYEDCKILADVLSQVLSDRDDIVVVASTDMSHFLNYDDANKADSQTIEIMKQFKYPQIFNEGMTYKQPCCGYSAVACVLKMAEALNAKNFQVLKYANSGDTTDNKQQVVGYLSAAVYKESSAVSYQSSAKELEGRQMLNEGQRKRLLEIARESITSFVKSGKRQVFKEDDPVLNKPLGAFVTLHENGQLRGCIGNMVGSGPLYKLVANMAIESATGDPRFPVLSASEIDRIDIEISVLSQMERVKYASCIKIPGQGVLVRRGFNSGVYLPQVATETGWNKEEFLTSLCASKAGISPDAWKQPDTELYVFTAEVFGEKE